MLSLKNIAVEHIFGLDMEAGPGSVVFIRTATHQEVELILGVMLGGRKPEAGSVTLFGDLNGGRTPVSYAGRVCVAYRNGALISNLSVYENITLPARYHNNTGHDELFRLASDIYGMLGIRPDKLKSYASLGPSDIPPHERRLAGLVRTMLVGPQLVVYESALEGLRSGLRDRVAETLAWFHHESGERASVFVGTDNGPEGFLDPDISISL